MCQIWKLVLVLPTVYVCASVQNYLYLTHTNTQIQYTPRLKWLRYAPQSLERYLCLLKVTL